MKALLTFSFLLAFSSIALAQVPNGNFEEWEVINGIEQPAFWQTFNTMCCRPVVKTTDAIEGDFSMKVFTTLFSDGSIYPGDARVFFAPTQPYQYLNAAIKIDSIELGKVEIKIYIPSGEIYTRIGSWESNSKTNGLLQISIPLSQSPDTMVVAVSAFNTEPGEGYSEVIIDNLELSLVSSTSATDALEAIKVFPNPVRHGLTIELPPAFPKNSTWKLYDQLGQQVQSVRLDSGQKRNHIQTDGLANGIYFYQIESNGRYMGSGKIVVQN